LTPAEIKLKRYDSILGELVPEALSQLNDARLRELDVIEVRCSKGRSDAKVYLDPHDYTEKERTEFIRMLDKARAIIENHCMKDQGWFRCPRLTFEFDDQLEASKNIEDLFRQIAKEKSDES
jgi:ribosome-binding factor A